MAVPVCTWGEWAYWAYWAYVMDSNLAGAVEQAGMIDGTINEDAGKESGFWRKEVGCEGDGDC